MQKFHSEIKSEYIESTILPAVNDEESSYLSAFYLSNDPRLIPQESKIAMIAKGLIEVKNDTLTVGKAAYPVIADYPLFGNYKKTKGYIHEFFPVVLSILANGLLSIKTAYWTKYINSEFFTSIFPSRNAEMIARAGVATLKAFIALSIAKEGISRLTVDKELALSFFSLNEETRLSYILNPLATEKEIENIAKAISLVFRLREIKEEDLKSKLNLIEELSGFDLSEYLDFLLDFGILYKTETGYSGTDINIKAEADGIISSDFTYSATKPATIPLFMFLVPVKSDVTYQWLITKTSIKTAFSLGYKPNEIKANLSALTRFPLPESVISRVDSWYEDFSSLRAKRALVLIANERNKNILDNLPLLKIHILAKPSDNVFIMNPDTEIEWRNILTYTGFDMLGATEGPKFESEPENKVFKDIKPMPTLPGDREIPYDRQRVETALATASDKIALSFIKAGVLIDRKEFPITAIEGLFFQEKLKAINSAIDEDKLIYTEYIDKEAMIIKPIKVTKEVDHYTLVTTNGEISVDKIWKVAVLPSFVRDSL